ncbi:uncharacterized protein EI90DRAFT_3036143 [Cantharellus anzutake]|uniref:uncharacterized protein n=1 Tax=Cantharellus anzutake TaxID=1750568 RepID=UPI0019041675|nr:uncharacterized protein EI90DRAFT_3036143 [Cantharellus anzutake]KAF8340605.1 hypothetical protein EI90DRAFT_3036143 [Cantharellus anzutake]
MTLPNRSYPRMRRRLHLSLLCSLAVVMIRPVFPYSSQAQGPGLHNHTLEDSARPHEQLQRDGGDDCRELGVRICLFECGRLTTRFIRFGDKHARKHPCLVLHITRDWMPDSGRRIGCLWGHTRWVS